VPPSTLTGYCYRNSLDHVHRPRRTPETARGARQVQKVQTESVGKFGGDPLGAQRDLRDRATAASPEDHRPEGRIVKDGVKKALRDRQDALSELVDAIRLYRTLADKTPLTLREAHYAQAVERLNAAVDRADGLVSP
jgi:hypothetical protein